MKIDHKDPVIGFDFRGSINIKKNIITKWFITIFNITHLNYNLKKMLSKKINFGCTFKKIYDQYQSQDIILKTCQTVSKVASITLGPKGRNVLI